VLVERAQRALFERNCERGVIWVGADPDLFLVGVQDDVARSACLEPVLDIRRYCGRASDLQRSIKFGRVVDVPLLRIVETSSLGDLEDAVARFVDELG
jgi:hypothetical protein